MSESGGLIYLDSSRCLASHKVRSSWYKGYRSEAGQTGSATASNQLCLEQQGFLNPGQRVLNRGMGTVTHFIDVTQALG